MSDPNDITSSESSGPATSSAGRAESLPADIAACHAMIRDLRRQLAEKTKLIVGRMGYDPTDTSAVFGFAEAMGRISAGLDSPAMRKAIEEELAAEDANRRRRKRR